MAEPDLSLAVPCYNEEACIRGTAVDLCRAFAARGIDLELVLVDNGSTDRTGLVIDQLVAEGLPVVKVTVPINQGYGYGVIQGLGGCGGRWVGFLCADGQVDAEDVVRSYQVASRADRDVLVKVRRRFRMDGLDRKLVSVAYNGLAVGLFGGLGSLDLNGNPKLFPRRWLAPLDLQSHDWFLDPEIMIKAKALGLPVVEINVFARSRQGGVSHVKPDTCLEFLKNLLRYRVRGPFPGGPPAAPRGEAR